MNVIYFGTDKTALVRANKMAAKGKKILFCDSADKVLMRESEKIAFVVLSGKECCIKDFELLRGLGIDPYKIEFYENYEWRRGCSFLGQYLWYGRSYYRSCVYRRGEYLNKPYSGDIKRDFDSIRQSWGETIEHWRRKEPTPCDGCFILKEQVWPRTIEFKSLSLYGGFKGECCNFRCIYCDATENLKLSKCKDSITMVDAILSFAEALGNNNFSVALSAGEISVSPYREEIFSLLRNLRIRTSIFSNGYIFDKYIYEALENNGSINISLDSGTPDTFKKIKGIDGYNQVIYNISRYHNAKGKIELKYIILEGVNDNEKDIDGFISICKKYASSVRLSCDKFRYKDQLSDNSMTCLKHIVEFCKSFSIPVSFSYSQFNDEDCCKLRNMINQ